MKPIKVLQIIVGGKNFNGVAGFLYQFYKNIDHEKVHFDFLFIRENAMALCADDPVFADSKFYVLNAVKKNKKTDHMKMIKGIDTVLKKKHYDAVHINTLSVGANVPIIRVCKKNNISKIISHSHNEYSTRISKVKLLSHKVFQPYITKNADLLFACSEKAGECLFGKKGIRSEKYHQINNAVDPEVFYYSAEKRSELRKQMNIPDGKVVIGQIGRLSAQKNQSFSLKVYAEFFKVHPDSEFWIIGGGPDEQKIRQQIGELSLDPNVKILGQRNDINDLMNVMDALLFPSLWEGFGTVAMEAQATGLPVLASTNVPAEAAATDLVSFLSLDEPANAWAEKLAELSGRPDRKSMHGELDEKGFTIKQAAIKLEELYGAGNE
ncbi:MAG: glycosyltransferase [Lachnospiraceae bacterium]|nr:glycosyltransferase [Lachnospiraceae bacterium]